LGWTVVDDAAATKTGFTLTLCAAIANEPDVIRELAAQGGVDFNRRLKVSNFRQFGYLSPGATPLMTAMAFSEFSLVEALLDANADPHKTVTGISALHFCACRGNVANVAAWLKRFPRWDVNKTDQAIGIHPGGANAMNGIHKQAILQDFIAAGLDVHSAPCWGGQATMLCLMAISEDPDLQAVKLLLDLRCDPNERWKPMRYMWKAVFTMARIAPPACTTRWAEELGMMPGATPLHFAAKRGDVDLISLLMSAGGKADVKNVKGQTPLEVAEIFFGVVPALVKGALLCKVAT